MEQIYSKEQFDEWFEAKSLEKEFRENLRHKVEELIFGMEQKMEKGKYKNIDEVQMVPLVSEPTNFEKGRLKGIPEIPVGNFLVNRFDAHHSGSLIILYDLGNNLIEETKSILEKHFGSSKPAEHEAYVIIPGLTLEYTVFSNDRKHHSIGSVIAVASFVDSTTDYIINILKELKTEKTFISDNSEVKTKKESNEVNFKSQSSSLKENNLSNNQYLSEISKVLKAINKKIPNWCTVDRERQTPKTLSDLLLIIRKKGVNLAVYETELNNLAHFLYGGFRTDNFVGLLDNGNTRYSITEILNNFSAENGKYFSTSNTYNLKGIFHKAVEASSKAFSIIVEGCDNGLKPTYWFMVFDFNGTVISLSIEQPAAHVKILNKSEEITTKKEV